MEPVVRTASGAALDGREGRAELTRFRVLPRGHAGGIAWSGGVGRVMLRNVPESRVQLEAYWSRGWFPLEPAHAAFEVPGELSELIVRDDLPAEEFVVHVIEPEVAGRVTIPLAGGSQGTLCVGGAIGRFVGPGQVQSSGAAGSFTLALDWGVPGAGSRPVDVARPRGPV